MINDGSTDGSALICQKWSRRDTRIRYIEKEHSGLGATRNFGIKKALGEYIMFLDSDDWAESCFVEHMYRSITEHNADMAFCDYYKVDGTKKIPFLTKAYTEETIVGEARNGLIYGADVAMWIKIYKKDVFMKENIQIPDGPYEDTATYPLIVSSCEKIVHLKEKLLYYRINRKGSILSIQKNRKFAVNALEYVCSKMQKKGIFSQYKKELERFCARFISYSLREMDTAEFEKDKKELIDFFYNTFPGAENPYGKYFLSIGSNNLYCILNQIPYDLNMTIKMSLKEMPIKYVKGRFNYIAIDFQQDCIKQEQPEEKEIQKTADLFNETDEERIFLVKSRLAYAYGEYCGTDSFKQQMKIKQANAIIEKKEEIFLKAMKKDVSIITNEKKYLLFSDVFSRHGCMPYYMNDAYYLEMADEIIKRLRER